MKSALKRNEVEQTQGPPYVISAEILYLLKATDDVFEQRDAEFCSGFITVLGVRVSLHFFAVDS